MSKVDIASFYGFVPFPDYREWREPLIDRCREVGVGGTILLAHEGVNGTIAGPAGGIEAVLELFRTDPRFDRMRVRITQADRIPFGRLRVRLKKEIVTMKAPEADPTRRVGEYVAPQDWNDLIAQPDVTVIDTRNAFEVELGRFEGAVDPKTRSFGEFPSWADTNLDPSKHRRIAMYCTGGIRCEKATAYLLERGFENVYHLEGGILAYLDRVEPEKSQWHGECFVFDERGSES